MITRKYLCKHFSYCREFHFLLPSHPRPMDDTNHKYIMMISFHFPVSLPTHSGNSVAARTESGEISQQQSQHVKAIAKSSSSSWQRWMKHFIMCLSWGAFRANENKKSFFHIYFSSWFMVSPTSESGSRRRRKFNFQHGEGKNPLIEFPDSTVFRSVPRGERHRSILRRKMSRNIFRLPSELFFF